jgi:hypothetical protein
MAVTGSSSGRSKDRDRHSPENITVTASVSPALAAGSGHYADLSATNVVVNAAPFDPPQAAP